MEWETMREETDAQLRLHGKQERGEVQVNGETIGYTLCKVDARTEGQRIANARDKALDGNLNVYVPGHGQRAAAARNLIATIVALSSSKVLWAIDIDPPQGGDPARAEALVKIIRRKASEELFGGEGQESAEPPFFRVTIFGWSHGGAETMQAAEKDPALFQQVVGLCPAGLVKRSPYDLVWSFLLECLRILRDALPRLDWTITRVLAIGYDILAGLFCDLVRSKSLRRVINDVRWACGKVTGKDYEYDGKVVILFGEQDGVIRWRDVFPTCQHPGNIGQFLEEYKKRDFPMALDLQVRVLEGSHIAPETHAPLYVKTAFDLLERSSS
jgi:pimeloyl-ACP methyl ester carboxylesterase